MVYEFSPSRMCHERPEHAEIGAPCLCHYFFAALKFAFSSPSRACRREQASQNVKNKEGKWGVKMMPVKFGDMRFWGSSLFERLEKQVRRACKPRYYTLGVLPCSVREILLKDALFPDFGEYTANWHRITVVTSSCIYRDFVFVGGRW